MLFVGECWSGPEAGETYQRNGISPKCITKEGQPCTPDKSDVCAGEQETNYVYGIDLSSKFCLFCFTLILILLQSIVI